MRRFRGKSGPCAHVVEKTRAAFIRDFGGRYVAATEKITALDGIAPKRFIVVAFDSPEKALAWFNSPRLKEATAMRVKATKSRSFFFEGM